MITNTIDYLRRNAIALTALGFALLALAGGTYAAVSVPRGSVGPAQLNRHLIAGYVRAWATLNGSPQVLASSGGAKLSQPPGGPMTISWPGRFPRSCTAIVGSNGLPGGADFTANYRGHGKVVVFQSGTVNAEGMSVVLVC